MPPAKTKTRTPTRDVLLKRLKEHSGLSAERINFWTSSIIGLDHFRRCNHNGGGMEPFQKYFERDGREHTLRQVPLDYIVEELESLIRSNVPEDVRSEVYRKVLVDCPGFNETPEWDKEPLNPNGEPLTPFSKPSHVKSNQELLDAFASAAELDADTVSAIKVQITWWDGAGDPKRSCSMSFADGVRGGRLGRDHTFEDVPSNYVRDRLMDYTTTKLADSGTSKLSGKKQRAARKALCPELTDRQIQEYLDLLAKDKWEKEAGKNFDEEVGLYNKALDLLQEKKVGTYAEGRNLALLEEALKDVNTDVDLTPKPLGIRRNVDLPVLILGSVVKPGDLPLHQEGQIVYQYEVDRDCDQIRAMIKIFLDEGEWTVSQYCRAVQDLTRKQLTAFLNMRGHDKAQTKLKAYLLSWEFFNFRDALGLPLRGANIAKDIAAVERQKGRPDGRKRIRAQAETDKTAPKAKRQKKSDRAPLQEIVNEAGDGDSDEYADGTATLEELRYRQIHTFKPGRTYVVVGAA